jgi:hypothetical protein
VSSREETLGEFFGRYVRVSLGAEPEKLADFYDTSFLVAGPKGGAAFKNDEIGAGYTLVTVAWAATFVRTGDTPIRFSISYLLCESEASRKIAAYISHEDEEEVMRAHGLS